MMNHGENVFGKAVEVAELKRIIKWAMENIDEWEIICGINRKKLSHEEFDRVAGILLAENFHQAYYILFYRYADQENMQIYPKGI